MSKRDPPANRYEAARARKYCDYHGPTVIDHLLLLEVLVSPAEKYCDFHGPTVIDQSASKRNPRRVTSKIRRQGRSSRTLTVLPFSSGQQRALVEGHGQDITHSLGSVIGAR